MKTITLWTIVLVLVTCSAVCAQQGQVNVGAERSSQTTDTAAGQTAAPTTNDATAEADAAAKADAEAVAAKEAAAQQAQRDAELAAANAELARRKTEWNAQNEAYAASLRRAGGNVNAPEVIVRAKRANRTFGAYKKLQQRIAWIEANPLGGKAARQPLYDILDDAGLKPERYMVQTYGLKRVSTSSGSGKVGKNNMNSTWLADNAMGLVIAITIITLGILLVVFVNKRNGNCEADPKLPTNPNRSFGKELDGVSKPGYLFAKTQAADGSFDVVEQKSDVYAQAEADALVAAVELNRLRHEARMAQLYGGGTPASVLTTTSAPANASSKAAASGEQVVRVLVEIVPPAATAVPTADDVKKAKAIEAEKALETAKK